MSTAIMTDRITKTSPRLTAPNLRISSFRVPSFTVRAAGVLSLLTVMAAAFAEFYLRGNLNVTGSLIAVSAMIAATLLFYDTLSRLSRRSLLLAASFNLVGLAFELFRLQIRGANIAVVFDGFFCILIACLVFGSTFASRILGGCMVLGGLGWLTFLSSPLAIHLSPYNLALGLLGMGSICLWLQLRTSESKDEFSETNEAYK